jgi:hypothetical protein
MRSVRSFVPLVALALLVSGCASRSGTQPEAAPAVPIPADSPLAQIKPGMRMSDAVQALGEPTDKNKYMSGKA